MSNNTPIGTRIERAAQTAGTWAGGSTSAIYAYPPEAIGAPATALLWAGTAVISRAAAYSHFPERLRIHIPIQGSGIRLHFQNPVELIALSTFAQHRFDGARPVQVELVAGPVEAFNLIVQTDVAAAVRVLQVGSQELALELDDLPATQTARATNVVRIICAVNGAVELAIAGQPAVTLNPADAFVFHPRAVDQPLGVRVGLRSLNAYADLIVATLVFGSDTT
jgi:environmental stress-induced protein Ves